MQATKPDKQVTRRSKNCVVQSQTHPVANLGHVKKRKKTEQWSSSATVNYTLCSYADEDYIVDY